MIPEQVWDAEDIPERFLFNGHPAGSGMPLVWAHSEYIKLLRSLHNGAIWDLPTQTVDRYLKQEHSAAFQIWTTKQRRAWLSPGKDLRVDLSAPADIEWIVDERAQTESTCDTGFHLHVAMLRLRDVRGGSEIKITIHPKTQGVQLTPDSFSIRDSAKQLNVESISFKRLLPLMIAIASCLVAAWLLSRLLTKLIRHWGKHRQGDESPAAVEIWIRKLTGLLRQTVSVVALLVSLLVLLHGLGIQGLPRLTWARMLDWFKAYVLPVLFILGSGVCSRSVRQPGVEKASNLSCFLQRHSR